MKVTKWPALTGAQISDPVESTSLHSQEGLSPRQERARLTSWELEPVWGQGPAGWEKLQADTRWNSGPVPAGDSPDLARLLPALPIGLPGPTIYHLLNPVWSPTTPVLPTGPAVLKAAAPLRRSWVFQLLQLRGG